MDVVLHRPSRSRYLHLGGLGVDVGCVHGRRGGKREGVRPCAGRIALASWTDRYSAEQVEIEIAGRALVRAWSVRQSQDGTMSVSQL